jgi:hypothetical protein
MRGAEPEPPAGLLLGQADRSLGISRQPRGSEMSQRMEHHLCG